MVAPREMAAFDDSLQRRNRALLTAGAATQPAAKKTGTTIAGVVYKDGVVLGADTRSTNGDTVADKNCEKIHYISDNIYCCGAGTAADTEAVTGTRRARAPGPAGGRERPPPTARLTGGLPP